jgi:hypothetical protein
MTVTEKWMSEEGVLTKWILEGLSGRTLPVALSVTLLSSWRRPYSVLVIGLAVLWVAEDFVGIIDLTEHLL